MPTNASTPVVDAVALGRRLRARREELGLAQDTLAHSSGISRVQLQNIEVGLSDRAKRTPANPRLETLVALCRELGGRLTIDLSRPGAVIIEFDSTGPTP